MTSDRAPAPSDQDWIALVTNGEVTRFDKTTAGRSRGTWLVDVAHSDGTTDELVLRRDTGDGPLSGTELSLERESHVYAALQATGVAVPRLIAVADDSEALLVERIAGTEDLNALDEDRRAHLVDSFVDTVATLHAVDVADLSLPGFHRPETDADHALGDLALWQRILDDHVGRPLPALHLAMRWLRENPPSGPERTVLCHGDLGPGNFMQRDGEITGLLDWEFAHLGDPMDDIAWLSIRSAQIPGLGDLDSLIDRYRERSGTAVDAHRVRYYQLFVLARMAIACSVGLARRGNGAMDASTYFALLPLLQLQMSVVLADLAGVGVEAAAPLPAAPPTTTGAIVETLSTDLGSVLGPELQTEAARSRLMGMVILLSHLSTADTLGAAATDRELDDLTDLLGTRPTDLVAADAALNELISSDGCPFESVLAYIHRRAGREIQLWPVLAAVAATPLPRVAGR